MNHDSRLRRHKITPPPPRDEVAYYRLHKRGERARIYLPTETIIAVESIVGLDATAVSEWIDTAIRRRLETND